MSLLWPPSKPPNLLRARRVRRKIKNINCQLRWKPLKRGWEFFSPDPGFASGAAVLGYTAPRKAVISKTK